MQRVLRRGVAEMKLFTPGPLSVSKRVKEAMLTDFGSRDIRFVETVQSIRADLLAINCESNVRKDPHPDYTTVLMQGSGTFGIEAVVHHLGNDADKRVLVIDNGVYGERIADMVSLLPCELTHFKCDPLHSIQHEGEKLIKILANSKFHSIFVVHSETSFGVLNDLDWIGGLRKQYQPDAALVVDAMSSYGAYYIPLHELDIDFCISSANKCVQGVPGFSFVVAKRSALDAQTPPTTLSLDLKAQMKGLEGNGQFRFTPPTHALMAFRVALDELIEEGGIGARYARYAGNQQRMMSALQSIGFRPMIDQEEQSVVISSFHNPQDANFDFEQFYSRLSEKGSIIYPGKLANCFRIGSIGDLHQADFERLVDHIQQVLVDMDVKVF